MAWLVFVLAFVVLGLGVVIAAFGGTRRRTPGGPGRTARRGIAVTFGVLIAATGVALPAVALLVNHDDQARATGGVRLDAAEQHGRVLFAQHCSTCHTLSAANAVGRVGPNLDTLRPPAGLVEDAVLHGRARGSGQMPVGLLVGKDLKDVAAFVARTAGR
jgi:mono/diheme cytochrome c family protein